MLKASSYKFIQQLCRADKTLIHYWLNEKPKVMFATAVPTLITCCAIYGGTLGYWHNSLMALFVAIKFPLAILITLCITSLINAIIAMISGSGISPRQSLQFLLIGFTTFSILLASVSPVLFFMNLNTATAGEIGMERSYNIFLTTNVVIISLAGITAFRMLLRHVRHFASSSSAGNRTFAYWLAINFFAGAQVTYLLRPFFGNPAKKTEFLRENMFEGNFYETLFSILSNLFSFTS